LMIRRYLVITILTKLILKCFYFHIIKFWYLKALINDFLVLVVDL
jgi:hypothetical protein